MDILTLIQSWFGEKGNGEIVDSLLRVVNKQLYGIRTGSKRQKSAG